MKFPKCQFDNREGVKFCKKCGAKMELVFPNCGAGVPLDRQFCAECGHDLRKPKEAPPIDYSQPQSYTPKFLADKILNNTRNRSATYELTLRSEKRYQSGDQISYYVTGDSGKVQAYDHCNLASEWDPSHPDENTRYYQKKLRDLYKNFLYSSNLIQSLKPFIRFHQPCT
jgi:hypothetical protein